ncbi:hypothetical protein FB45DRAFT_826962 [Roridomyces roridus]|uniref:Carrier domain-containing protein n=1 Tax=Roridomyces roridus TaxID=1738132 RepID=A0AAD7C444_9AGAR|nr:hypothetical protein FB45DRAFT_826962 [Roridomyces roridus]
MESLNAGFQAAMDFGLFNSHIEEVRLATPLQNRLLRGLSPHFPSSATFIFSLPLDADIEAFRTTWKAFQDSTPILRTTFFALPSDAALSVVLKPGGALGPSSFGNLDLFWGKPLHAVKISGGATIGYRVEIIVHYSLIVDSGLKSFLPAFHQFYHRHALRPEIMPVLCSDAQTGLTSMAPPYQSITRHCSSTTSDSQPYIFRIAFAVALAIQSAGKSSPFVQVQSSTSLSEARGCLVDPAVDPALSVRQFTRSNLAARCLAEIGDSELEAVQSFLFVHDVSSWPRTDDIPVWELDDVILSHRVPLAVEIIPCSRSIVEIRLSSNTTARPVEDINAFADDFVSAVDFVQNCGQIDDLTVHDILLCLSDRDATRTLEFGRRSQLSEDSFPDSLVHELFEGCARENPDAIALEFEASSTLTYAELDRLASDLAVDLQNDYGVGTDVLVPIFFENSFEMIISLLAVMKAGGAYVPLAVDMPQHTLKERLEIIGANVLVCGSSLVSRAMELCAETRILLYSLSDSDVGRDRKPEPRPMKPTQLAYSFITSGTTGKPNCVSVEHRNLTAFMASTLGIEMSGKDKKKLLVSPYMFDISVADIFTTLTSGGVLALVGRAKMLSNLPYWLDATKTTHLSVTPSIGRLLPTDGLPSLTHIIFGGEPLPPDLALRMSQTRTVINSMGPTEATIYDTLYYHPPSSDRLDRTPIGYPLNTTQLYVLRPGTMELAARGETGEICIGGPQVSRGYITNPELTRKKFVPDIFTKGADKIFRTGDWGRWNRFGQLEILGRMDGQLKFHGIRVEGEEIERVVRGASEDVDEFYSAVLELDGYQKLVGVFTLRENHTHSLHPGSSNSSNGVTVIDTIQTKHIIDLIISACQAQLPPTIRPSVLLGFSRLPKTLNNKLDRPTLNRHISEHIAKSAAQRPDTPPTMPRTATEDTVVGVIATVLALPEDSVRLGASFLELGGTSMQAMRVTTSLQAIGIDVNVLDILDSQRTIAQIAHLPRFDPSPAAEQYTPFSLAPREWEAAVRSEVLSGEEVEDVYPCVSLAKYWLELAFRNDGRALICQFNYELGKEIDPERFCWAWDQLRNNEPTLRTVLVMVLHRSFFFQRPQDILSSVVLSPKTQGRGAGPAILSVNSDQELQELIYQKCFAEHKIEMGVVPIRSWLILNTATDVWSFAISRHHALHDARTFDLQHDAFSLIYAGAGAENRKKNDYGAYVASILKDPFAEEAESFWKRYLRDAHCPTWPATKPVPATFCKDMSTYAFHVAEWTGDIAELAGQLGVTSGTVIRAAYAVAMAEGEGNGDCLVFEVADGSGAIEPSAWGFCAHVKPTRVQVTTDLKQVVHEANRSHAETLPYLGSAWDMTEKMLGSKEVNFATAIINVLDLSKGDFRKDMKGQSRAPGAIFDGTLVSESVTGIYVPAYVEVHILKGKVMYLCPYDPSLVKREDMERLVQRQIDVLGML